MLWSGVAGGVVDAGGFDAVTGILGKGRGV